MVPQLLYKHNRVSLEVHPNDVGVYGRMVNMPIFDLLNFPLQMELDVAPGDIVVRESSFVLTTIRNIPATRAWGSHVIPIDREVLKT